VQQRLEEMLRLALGFALLGAETRMVRKGTKCTKTFRVLRIFREFRDSHLPPKRPMQQRLEQVLRLALGFALLGAQPLELVDDVGELLLKGEGGDGTQQ
jgi:hypothetical protein